MSLSLGKKFTHLNGIKVSELCPPLQFQCNKSNKIVQCERIQSILQQHLYLERVKYDLERVVKQQRLNELRQNVKETKLKLNNVNHGEFDAIKNILRSYKPSIRLGKSMEKLFEHCESKRNNKQRELNRLTQEVDKLTEAYASKLTILTMMQNQRRHSHKLLASRIKNQTEQLNKSEMEIQSYEKLLEDLRRAVKCLSKESLQYANILKALELEISEQKRFLDFLRKVKPIKRATVIQTHSPQLAKEQALDEPATNDVHVPHPNDPKTMEVATNRPLRRRVDCSQNELMTLHSIVKRIQSKLIACKEKVNVLENQVDETKGKVEYDTLQCNSKKAAHGLVVEQNDSSEFQRSRFLECSSYAAPFS